MRFDHAFPATDIHFGHGARNECPAILETIGARRVLVVGSSGAIGRNSELIESWAPMVAGVFDGARPHCPEATVSDALDRFRCVNAGGAVVIGGGSTIGLGKQIRKRFGKPLVVLPTTYSGSEMTAIYGMKIGTEKRTWIDADARPDAVIYDPELTFGLPASDTASSGMNCLAHLVEGLYGRHVDPVATALAERGIAALRTGLPGSIDRPENASARADALLGGYLGGLVVSLAGIALHHRICHVLGGRYELAHGVSHSVILPYAVAYNAEHAPDAIARINAAFGTDDAAAGIHDFARRIKAPRSLKAAGMPEEGIDVVARETIETLAHNPREPDRASLVAMLSDAWAGRPPGSY